MTAPARPKWVRITGPRGANYVTVGRVYRVVNWRGPSPIVHDDNDETSIMAIEGDASGSAVFPAWVPCGPPPTIEALKAEVDALRAENDALRAEVASHQAANAALQDANEKAASLTTPASPKYIRITGPRNAYRVTVGRVYLVVDWFGPAPVVRRNDGCLWSLDLAGGAGSWLEPTWEPCEGPAGKEDPS